MKTAASKRDFGQHRVSVLQLQAQLFPAEVAFGTKTNGKAEN